MKDNGLSNMMELIKRQRWEKLFKRRELVHVDAVKEFYARMTLVHLKEKDVVKSSVKGVAIEFDHLKLASILGIPGNNRICEYLKDVWEESKYTKPLEITRKFANDETLTTARRVKSSTGENRRRDDEIEAPTEEVNEEEVQNDFHWEAVIDEAADQGESGSGEKFYDAEDEIQESAAMVEEVSAVAAQDSAQQKETEAAEVDPSGPSGHIPESMMIKLQAEFERARANRIQADLKKAQVENARLLALLQQAKNPPKP
ncbi:hypothetical protein Dimus_030676 [Dionaea muscipula]